MSFYLPVQGDRGFTIAFYPNPRDEFGAFANGYRCAADLLARSLLARPGYRDYEAYPIVFLYRHSLELSLKNIIYKGAKLVSFRDLSSVDSELHNRHRLPNLAQVASAVLNVLFPSDGKLHEVMDSARATARDLDEIDPLSQSFRYPIDREGNYGTKAPLSLGIVAISRHMSGLLEELDTINFGLNIEIDQAEAVFEILQSLRHSS